MLTLPRGLAIGVVALAATMLQAASPNVLLIVSDDQAWGDYGFMGHPTIETPRLDRLADESLTFTRGYVTSSLCSPSLATIITGRYPREHGVTGNDPAWPAGLERGSAEATRLRNATRERLIGMVDRVDTLPRLLARHGYESLQTGKWWLGGYARGGFTDGMTRGFPAPGGRHGDDGLTIGRQGVQPIADFLDRSIAAERPFFVWYAPFLPHTPHNPPERLLDKYRTRTDSLPIAKYWANCEWFDETVSAVLDAVDRRGLREDTLVVYVTDNGWINRPDASRYAPRSKRSPNEGGLRTPIMVRWPGRITPRRDEATLASSIDLAPTILAACGVDPPDGLPGIDLLDRPALEQRDQVFGAIYAHDITNLAQPSDSLEYRWTIHGRWKLIRPNAQTHPDEAAELYDVINDPRELRNLAAQEPARVSALTGELDAWWSPSKQE